MPRLPQDAAALRSHFTTERGLSLLGARLGETRRGYARRVLGCARRVPECLEDQLLSQRLIPLVHVLHRVTEGRVTPHRVTQGTLARVDILVVPVVDVQSVGVEPHLLDD